MTLNDILKERPEQLPTVEELNAEFKGCRAQIQRLEARTKELKALYLWAKHPGVKVGTWVHPVNADGSVNKRKLLCVIGMSRPGFNVPDYSFECRKVRRDGSLELGYECYRNVAIADRQPDTDKE